MKTKTPTCKRCGSPLRTIADYYLPCAKAIRAKHHALTLAQWCKLKGEEIESRERCEK